MIVAVANQKGGVAKTTATICLGGLLAQLDSCLVVDLDPQGNLTTGLGAEVAEGQLSAYEVILFKIQQVKKITSQKVSKLTSQPYGKSLFRLPNR